MQLQQQIEQLFFDQQRDWCELKNALRQLSNTQTKEFDWGNDIRVSVKFNQAQVALAYENQLCHLCQENRPKLQSGISFLDKYIILANPRPILHNHLTIALHSHVAQRIRKKIGDMLTLAEVLPNYIVFYNGAKCGVSASEHFHLQTGLKTPLLLAGENELRTCLIIESTSKREVEERFADVYQYLHSRQSEEEEPMMNLIAFTENNNYVLHIFPRKAYRPKQFYETGRRKLLVSPGALDMAGMFVVVREEDFEKIGKDDIEDIYSQVSMPII